MYDCRREALDHSNGEGERYFLQQDGEDLNYAQFIDALIADDSFREFLSKLLAESPYRALRWECRPVTAASVTQPFEFVVLNAPDLDRPADRTTFADLFERTDQSRIWRFAVVVDSDGLSGNNYVPPLTELNDPVKGTDSFYSLVYLPGDGWSFHLYLADGSEAMTAARVVLDGNALVFVIPNSEVPGPGAGFRVTTFTHKGDFGVGGDWSGDFHPKPPELEAIPD